MLESTEDLTNLSYLNEPAVLNSIRTRYTNRAQIYTYSGIVLVAVNPFSAVPLYGNELVQAYAGKRKGEVGGLLCLPITYTMHVNEHICSSSRISLQLQKKRTDA